MSDEAGEAVMGQSIFCSCLKGVQVYPGFSGVLSRGVMMPDLHS